MKPSTRTATALLAAARTGPLASVAFVASVRGCNTLYLRVRGAAVGAASQPCQWQRPPQPPSTQRFFQTSSRLSAALPAQDGPLMDEQIPARLVQVVNEEGRLNEPLALRDALRLVDKKTQRLVQMSAETEEQPAVCKILSKKDLYEQKKAKKKRASEKSNVWKQLEINWGISSHDLSHRLKKAKEFIDKGKSVEIVLLPKRKALPASQQQATDLLKEVKRSIIAIGGTESRKMNGALLGDLHLFVEKSKDSPVQLQQQQQQAKQAATAEGGESEEQTSSVPPAEER